MENEQSQAINFQCPNCQHSYQDELECLQHNQLHDVKCEACGQPFSLLIAECLACGEESTFLWRDISTDKEMQGLTCHTCSKPLFEEKDDGDMYNEKA